MAMRQYVGARYVPKFMGTYDATQAYDNMCVVDNGMGTSYISKVPTPAGTPLTDTDYWQLYGASSGAIINLQNQIDTINNVDLPAINTKLNNIDGVANRKFLFFGDSYGETYTSGGNTITGWLDQIVTLMGLSASQYAGSQALSGYGFLANGNAWIDLITPMTDDSTVTDIVFVGGHNDDAYVVDSPQLPTYIENTITTCRNKFPNAKIWVGFCSIETQYSTKTKKCYSIYSQTASKMGAAFLNGLEYVLFNSDYILNHAHPNNNGTLAMASALYSMLMGGGYYNGGLETTITYTADGNVQTTSHSDLKYTVENDHMIIEGVPTQPEDFSISFGTGIAVSANGRTAFVFDKPNNIPLMPTAKTIRLGTATGVCVYSGQTKAYTCSLTLTYYNGYLLGYLRALGDNGSYITATSSNLLTSITLSTPKFICDLLR